MSEARMSRAEKRLTSIEDRLSRLEEKLDIVREDGEDTNALLRTVLLGNGDASQGHVVRLDRLEQWKSTTTRMIWVLVGCVSSVGGGMVLWFIKGG